MSVRVDINLVEIRILKKFSVCIFILEIKSDSQTGQRQRFHRIFSFSIIAEPEVLSEVAIFS
jgi:hypothetical protein